MSFIEFSPETVLFQIQGGIAKRQSILARLLEKEKMIADLRKQLVGLKPQERVAGTVGQCGGYFHWHT